MRAGSRVDTVFKVGDRVLERPRWDGRRLAGTEPEATQASLSH